MAAMKSEKSTGEWTDETTIKLIEEYQTKTMLWDPKDDQYWKKDAKHDAWEEIGKAMGTNSDICKNKMFSVLSSFRREKSKIKHSQGPGKDASETYRSQWFAFPAMSFLLNRNNPRNRRHTESVEEIWIDEDTPQSNRNENILEMENSSPSPPKKKKPIEEKLDMMKVALGILNSAASIQPDDEITSFCSFVANKMNKYNETTKNAVQKAICDVVFKADRGYFDDE